MDPLTAGAITGGAGLLGGIMQNQANSAQAQRQMDFQRDMSNTAHTREVQDLRNAGLNPILSASGSGASTPGGAAASINNLAEGVSKGMDTAIAVKNANADVDLKVAQMHNTHDDSFVKANTSKLVGLQGREQQELNKQAVMQTELLEKTLPSMIKEAKAKGDYSQINQIMGIIKSGASSASDAASILSPLKIKLGK